MVNNKQYLSKAIFSLILKKYSHGQEEYMRNQEAHEFGLSP